MANRQIEAVLFDLGETLLTFGRLDRHEISNRAAHRTYDYLKEQHQPVGSFGAYRLFHLTGMYWHVLKSRITGNDFDSLDVLKRYGKKRGFTLSDEQWLELNWRWYETLRECGKVVTGSVPALKSLSEMGLKLGLLSNTFVHKSSLERHMAEEGLLQYLPMRMFSYEYPWRKPDVRIFQAAAERINVAPEKIAYIGDRIDFDVKGAQNAGMLPILIRAYTNENKAVPDDVDRIKDNTELVEVIQRYLKVQKKSPETEIVQHCCGSGK